MTTLPKLSWRASPNVSSRHGVVPHLIVVHRPVGSYEGSIEWLCNPKAQASAHVITERGRATQLAAWDHKAWACRAFNSVSYNVEVGDDAWLGDFTDGVTWMHAARLVAFLCHTTGIPARWSHQPTHDAGICRHYDLGLAGGGHTDPTTDDHLFRAFVGTVHDELAAGGFRDHYGRGHLIRL